MTKKIVQIAVTSDTDGDPIIHALCDDGSLYVRRYFKSGMRWELLPGIQPSEVAIVKRDDAIRFAEEWNSNAMLKVKIKFIARERTGEWIGFSGKPELDGEFWKPSDEGKCIRLHELQEGHAEFWKKTLTEIEA